MPTLLPPNVKALGDEVTRDGLGGGEWLAGFARCFQFVSCRTSFHAQSSLMAQPMRPTGLQFQFLLSLALVLPSSGLLGLGCIWLGSGDWGKGGGR